MARTVYTIGYAGFAITHFVDTLKAQEITPLADVRSHPHSRYFPPYNKETLEKTLRDAGILYESYAPTLGGMQTDPRYLSSEGYLDFPLYAESPSFRSGIDKLEHCIADGFSFCLMCAEKDPFRCHRGILISRAFSEAGYRVVHLLPDGIACTQTDLENRLLEAYFPSSDQISLFDQQMDRKEKLEQTYREKNKEMGLGLLKKSK